MDRPESVRDVVHWVIIAIVAVAAVWYFFIRDTSATEVHTRDGTCYVETADGNTYPCGYTEPSDPW